jgi:metallophosphoesterase (TIGR00282 family)
MKLLFIGDIVGELGRDTLKALLPQLKQKYQPDFIVVNGENAAGGRGITQKIAKEFYQWGVDLITMGNHTWDQKEIFDFIDEDSQLIRPANFPPGTPGRGFGFVSHSKGNLAVINLQGTTFLPPIDSPFRSVDELLSTIKSKAKYVLIDFHAEATSEKIAMGWYLDGKVSAVVGTHTHVPTADARILPNGTAFITDVGMVGPRDGILGMQKDAVIKKFITQLPVRFEVETGEWQFNAVCITLDPSTGFAKKIEPIHRVENQFMMD